MASVQHAPGEEPLRPDSDTTVPPTVSGDSRVEARDLADDEREIFSPVVVSGDSGFFPVSPLGALGAGAAGQKTGDVLEKHVSIAFISDTYELVEQLGPRAIQSSALAGHRQVLAGGSAANKLGCSALSPEGDEVAVLPDSGPVFRSDAIDERVDLDLRDALPSCPFKSCVKASDPGADGDESRTTPCCCAVYEPVTERATLSG